MLIFATRYFADHPFALFPRSVLAYLHKGQEKERGQSCSSSEIVIEEHRRQVAAAGNFLMQMLLDNPLLTSAKP